MNKKKIKKRVMSLLITILVSILLYYINENKKFESKIINKPFTLKCVDGDTFWLNGDKIRLLGVDAPEMSPEPEEYAIMSKDYTCELLQNSFIIELVVEEGNTIDKYNRLLYWVEVDGVLLQELLVRDGLAEIKYIKESTVIQKYYNQIRYAESQAKQERLNIWSQ